MSAYVNVKGAGAGVVAFFIAFFLAISALIGVWTDRSLEFWLTYAKGETVEVPFIISWLLSAILNAVILLFNIITELLRLVL